MASPDFLHKDAETELCECYVAAGAVCRLLTNSEQVIDAARDTFLLTKDPRGAAYFSIRCLVDPAAYAAPPWPKPYVRGLDHLVFASFDEGISMLADLRTRRMFGRLSTAMAADRAYCRTVIFPMLLTIIGASVGLAELHCACVAKDQNGVLLAGASGSGKSTLALALSQAGFGFLSDDRTFCSLDNGPVEAWGLPTRLKLRPEAALWFQDLRQQPSPVTPSENADLWFEPEQLNGVKRARRCRPTSLIFLEKRDGVRFALRSLSSAEALARLDRDLMAEFPPAAARRYETLRKVAAIPCWSLQYGGAPQWVAGEISQHLARL